MPLTFSHPAAVLPLFRGPLVPSALIAGSLAPDGPYFLGVLGLPVSAQSWYEPFLNATTSHSVLGAFTVSLPLAALIWVGVLVVIPPAVTILQGNLSTFHERNRPPVWRNLGWVALSLLVGIATHLLWDSFTHGWFAMNLPGFGATLFGDLTVARALQHTSTLVGLLAIIVFVWNRRDRWLPESHSPALARLIKVVITSVVAGTVGSVVLTLQRFEPSMSLEFVLSSAAVGFGIGVVTVAAVMVLCWWVVQWTASRRAPQFRR